MNPFLEWYRRVLALGIVANLAFFVGIFAAPRPILEFLEIPIPPLIWPRAVVMLVVLISLAYIPGWIDPVRYRWGAYYTIAARAAGSSFFVTQVWLGNARGFLNLALYDFSFGAVEGMLLFVGYHVAARGLRASTSH